MSFAMRAKAGRENQGGSFVFPKMEGWTRLKGWKFGLTKKTKAPMFTLELKILPGVEVLGKTPTGATLTSDDLKGRVVKHRVVIAPNVDWQFDQFLAYLEDSGIDLEVLDENDKEYKGIQECLEHLEDEGQKIKISLDPQDDDPRYYRLKFLEVTKVDDGPGGPIADDPDEDEPTTATPPTTTKAADPVSQQATQPVTQAQAAPVSTPAASTAEAPKKKKAWEK